MLVLAVKSSYPSQNEKAIAWIVDGDQLIRCYTAHMRPLTKAEQKLCSLHDGQTTSFHECVRHLPRRNCIDLSGQSAPHSDFEELVEPDHMSRDDKVSVHDQVKKTRRGHDDSAEGRISDRNASNSTTSSRCTPGQPLNSHSPMIRGFPSPPSSAEPFVIQCHACRRLKTRVPARQRISKAFHVTWSAILCCCNSFGKREHSVHWILVNHTRRLRPTRSGCQSKIIPKVI